MRATHESSRSRGGAVFVASRDGDLDVFADAASACAHLEAIDVDEGEHVAALRVGDAVRSTDGGAPGRRRGLVRRRLAAAVTAPVGVAGPLAARSGPPTRDELAAPP